MKVEIPLDDYNFLRRECPSCEMQFKWHNGPVNEEAESLPTPTSYFCPFCGEPANLDQWWTKQQLKYIQQRAMPEILTQLSNETGLRVESTTEAPSKMVETNDMVIVQSPCHPLEPVKVPEGRLGKLNCLVCGSEFHV